ncbi:MAG: putative Ig domain-containing protein, partial [Planctomycetota bacterium]
LAVSPATLPNATAGVSYSQMITTTPVAAGYSFAVTGGGLPTGLMLTSGGSLSGTPIMTGVFSFTVTAANVGSTCTFSRTYTVMAGCPQITLTPGSLPSGTAGVAYSQTIVPGGSTGSYTLAMTGGSLPPGLMFNPATGDISGAPTQVGVFNFTIRATDQFNCFEERAYALAITCPTITLSPDNLPDGTVSAAYSQALTAAPAGGNYSFAVTAGALPPGLTLAANGSLSGTLTQTGTFSFTVTATGYGGSCTGQRAYVVRVNCPAIALSPNNLTNSFTGEAYSQTITASGLGGSYTFAVSSGSLPPGLMLNTATGAITGMATTASANPFNFTITATNTASGCTGSQPYSVTISCPAIAVNAPASNSGMIGLPFSATFTQTGGFGAGSFATASSLPTGVTLATNGTLSGTPTQTGVFPIIVNFTDGNGCTGQQSYTLTIGPQTCVEAPANLSSWWRGEGNALDTRNANNGTAQGSATFAAGKVGQAFSFDGTNGYVALPDNFFPFPAAGTGTTPFTFETWFKTSTGGVIIGQQNTDPYTIPTGYVPGLYVGVNGKLHAEMFMNVGGINPIISSASVNDGVFHHVAVVYDGTTETVYLDGNAAGSAAHTQQSFTGPYKYQFGAGYTNGWPNGNGGWFNFNGLIDEATLYGRALTLAEIQSIVTAGGLGKCCLLTINPATLANGTVGAAYSQTVTASGGAGTYTFTASGTLPTGLTLSSGGVLSGTTTQPGLFSFMVSAGDQTNCTSTQVYTVAVDCPVISLSPAILTGAVVGANYNQTLVAAPAALGYAYVVTSGALPLGMALTMAGELGGTPTQSGIFSFTVSVTNASGSCTGSQAYQLRVDCPLIAISPGTLTGGTVGTVYSQMFTASGITGSYTFSTDEGNLPPGLTINSGTGVLSGTPTQAGTYDIPIRATHTASGCFGIVSFTLTITCPAISITPATLTAGTVGAIYNHSLTASGGTAGYTFALAVGSSLPAGLSLGSGGAISGMPSVPGTFTFTVNVTDNYGCMGSALISLTINCQTITVSNPGLNTGTVGTAFTATFTQTGSFGMATFSTSGTLPAGLMLSSAGVLSGTPTQSGSFPITIVATDSNACAGASTGYTLTIVCPTITVNPTTLPPGAVGTAYSQTITPSGGTSANYTYSFTG